MRVSRFDRDLARCQSQAQVAHPAANDTDARDSQQTRCEVPIYRTAVAWTLAGEARLIVVAAVLYWVAPAYLIRRRRLIPITADTNPALVACVADLSRQARVRPPRLLCDRYDYAPDGMAFGHLGQCCLCLPIGTVMRFTSDRAEFCAIVRHELAHLRNEDVSKTMFAQTLSFAFLFVVVIPFFVSLVGAPVNARFLLEVGLRIVLAVALVLLTLRAILRGREICADVRASTWDGPDGALVRRLAALPRGRKRLLSRLLSFHPDPTDRLEAIRRTDRLFQVGFWDAVATGIACSVVFPDISLLLDQFLIDSKHLLLVYVLTAMALGPLSGSVVGLGVWRATFATRFGATAPRRVGYLALGLGAGLTSGLQLSIARYWQQVQGSDTMALSAQGTLVWTAVLVAGLFLMLVWVAAAASSWLESRVSVAHIRSIYAAGIVTMSVLMAIVLGLAYQFRVILGFAENAHQSLRDIVVLSAVGPLLSSVPPTAALVLDTIIWAFPLAAVFAGLRDDAEPGPPWAYLETSSPLPVLPAQTLVRLGLTLRAAAVGGLIWSLVIVGYSAFIYPAARASNGDAAGRLLSVMVQQGAVAVIGEALIAAVVAWRVKRLRVLHGLAAASIGGLIMTATSLATLTWLGEVLPLSAAWSFISMVVGDGALLVVIVVAFVSLLASGNSFLRHRRPAPAVQLDVG